MNGKINDPETEIQPVQLISDSIYHRAGRMIYSYSKAVLGIVFGAYYLHECPAEEKIPIALIVCFGIILVTYMLNFPQDMNFILNLPAPGRPFFIRILDTVLHVILIGVFFTECYWVYSIHPNSSDGKAHNYCNYIFYHLVYWGTTFMLIVTAISVQLYIAIYRALDSKVW